MNIKDILIVGVALAMDAFGVTISIGLNKRVNRSKKIGFIISFALFQFLFFFSGAIMGFLFEKYITAIPNIIGGIAIGIVGVMMIREGFEKNENEDLVLKNIMYLILGVSVSIDALVVGFTTIGTTISYWIIFIDSIFIGIITLIICTSGFYFCRFIRKINFITKYADFLGGIILILFAFKMIFF